MDPRIENFQPCYIVTNSDSNREQLIAVGQILLFTERNSVCWSMARFWENLLPSAKNGPAQTMDRQVWSFLEEPFDFQSGSSTFVGAKSCFNVAGVI
tara:strand:+ start:87 stop:377 length:291 start_codon:yes stop_codon:yes gene_type:complete